MKEVLNFSSHEDWLKQRQSGIGGSEIGILMGVSSFSTPYQLYLRKKGEIPPTKENDAMRWGHYQEDGVAKEFELMTGLKIDESTKDDYIVKDSECDFIFASPDREFWFEDGTKGILECKTTHLHITEESLPKSWFYQLQLQLGLAEYKKGAIAWYDGYTTRVKFFEFDAEVFDEMKRKAKKFWQDTQDGIIPELNATDYCDVEVEGDTYIDVDEAYLEKCAEIKDIKAKIKELEAKQQLLEDEIKEAIAFADGITCNGNILATWKRSKDTMKFDAKRFEAENKDICKDYITVVKGSRRFLIK